MRPPSARFPLARRPLVSQRLYHVSPRTEILPLIGVAATALIIGRYSWRAMKRMEEEWEEYQWQLQQYEREVARSQPQATHHDTKTIAIDVGTIYAKMATSHSQHDVLITREGDRYFFNGLLYDDEGNPLLRGRSALEAFYYPTDTISNDPKSVVLPWFLMAESHDRLQQVIADVLTPYLQEAIDRMELDRQKVRYAIVVPPNLTRSPVYKSAFKIVSSETPIIFIPEPVATVWGAQQKGMIPTDEKLALVIDVGGFVTHLSLVQKDVVFESTSLHWGGEVFVKLLVDILIKDANAELNDSRSMAALQANARIALAELSNKTRVSVHIPYVFPEVGRHHLDTSLSRTVLDGAIQNDVREHLAGSLKEDGVLSPHLPVPYDLTSLWISTVTHLLESSKKTPADISYILMAGGGSKVPVVRQGFESALFTLMGNDYESKLFRIDGPSSIEMTVLGASTMLTGYDYSIDKGLHRTAS